MPKMTHRRNCTQLSIEDPHLFESPSWINSFTSNCNFLFAVNRNLILTCRVLEIFFAILGFCGNILSFTIWSSPRQKAKNTSALYLASLALSDTIILLTCPSHEMLVCFTDINNIPVYCHSQMIVCTGCQYLSITMAFGFTFERWMAVCRPFSRKLESVKRRFVIFLICAFVIAFLPYVILIPLFVKWDCKKNNKYEAFERHTLLVIEIVFSIIIPLMTLVFNMLVLKELRNLKQRMKQPNFNRCSIENHSTLLDSSTVMIIVLSFHLVLNNLTSGIIYMYQFYAESPNECFKREPFLESPRGSSYYRYQVANAVIRVIQISHYQVNLLVYVITHKGYRQQIKEYFGCADARRRQPIVSNRHNSMLSHNDSNTHRLLLRQKLPSFDENSRNSRHSQNLMSHAE